MQLTTTLLDEAILLLPTSPSPPPLAVGTYAVGSSGAPLFGVYVRQTGFLQESVVHFTGGTLTITRADAQLVSGTLDVTGTLDAGSSQVRVQADFTSHRSGYTGGG
jgi:hypothetical protein